MPESDEAEVLGAALVAVRKAAAAECLTPLARDALMSTANLLGLFGARPTLQAIPGGVQDLVSGATR
jgi:hypothetical protein